LAVRHIIVVTLILLLSACAPLSGTDNADALSSENDAFLQSELVLNMPTSATSCVEGELTKATLLDRGFAYLVAGQHVEAVTSFQRYRDNQGTLAASWEADIAIAYDSMMPGSPFYDPAAARISYARLEGVQPQPQRVHEKVLMMRDALAIFAEMAGRISDLRSDKRELGESLQVREEAIKRLRELTLGQ
jgi:hypothetical protein